MDPSKGGGGLSHHPHPRQHPHHHHQPQQHPPGSSVASSCNSSRRPSIHELSHSHLPPPSALAQPPTNHEPYHPGLLLHHHQHQPQPQPLGFFADSQSPYMDAPPVQHFGLNQYYPISTDSFTTTDPKNFPFNYTSPRSTVSDPIIPTQPLLQEESPEAPRRRRENRYRNAPWCSLAQNRASQRACRERKEQRIRDLEQLLRESTQREQSISHAYVTLQAECARHRAEHHSDTSGSASPPLSQQHQHDLGAMNSPTAFDPPAAAVVEEAADVTCDFHLHMMASYSHHM